MRGYLHLQIGHLSQRRWVRVFRMTTDPSVFSPRVIMRRLFIVFLVLAFTGPLTLTAQSICRDGTTSKASGRGACSHHGGVAKRAEPTPPTTRGSSGDIVLPTTPTPRASAQARERASDNSRFSEQGSVKVWVNTKSGVYHCPGTRWYGATKSGAYMTESQARAAGDRPAYGRSCS